MQPTNVKASRSELLIPEIAIFVGTRPEIIKMAPVITDLSRRIRKSKLQVIHTGQHYDWEMSEQFFKELGVPEPDEFLNVGSGSHGQQLAKIIESAESYLKSKKPQLAIVQGDTNSALGVALACAKSNLPLAHVEAGCRSFDKSMPEEINRVLISDCADFNFAPTENCAANLSREAVPGSAIFLTGHPIVTLISGCRSDIESSRILDEIDVERRNFVLLTTHRQENVDDSASLRTILAAAARLPSTVVFPVHPRTMKNVKRFGLEKLLKRLTILPPLPYFDTLRLIRDSEVVVTDSGGIQQESFLMKTPCLTIRKTTEWVETVERGVNFLVKNPRSLGRAFRDLEANYQQISARFAGGGELFGSKNSAMKISRLACQLLL